ncbi:uncharacterized protein METZ01_LOCUS249549 [marine metagenome]|uniref:Uncharacterized protein n=1 Tax=marine metagenome TaxID=408172 RepID=A0A382IBE1_9ZZZZ
MKITPEALDDIFDTGDDAGIWAV